MDSLGNSEWHQTFGDTGLDDGSDVLQAPDSGFIVVGQYSYFPNDSIDMYLVRTDSQGDMTWSRTYGAPGYSHAGVAAVRGTSDNGYVLAGVVSQSGGAGADATLLKVDSAGSVQWLRTYGETGQETASAVTQLPDGGFAFVGSTTSFGHGGVDVWLVRLNSAGDTVWTRTYGTAQDDICRSLIILDDGDFVIGGYSIGQGGNNVDLYVIRASASGDIIWSRHYGDALNQMCTAMCESADHHLAIFGEEVDVDRVLANFLLIEVDLNGDSLWAARFPVPYGSVLMSGEQTRAGGYIMAGGADYLGQPEQVQGYIVCTTPEGQKAPYPERIAVPEQFALTAYPNPFNPSTEIDFDLPVAAHASLCVFNALGQKVAKLLDETKPAGTYQAQWDGTGMPSGLYFYRLEAGDFVQTKKMVLMK